MAQQRYYASTAKQASLAASIDSVTTSITLDLTTGFPGNYPFTLAIDPDTNKEELVLVTSGAGTILTVTRGQDGTPAVAHSTGATVRHVASGQDFNQFSAHIGSTSVPTTSGVHGVTGNVVGTTDVQTITSKTFTGTESLGFDTVSPGTADVGVMAWNDTDGTIDFKLKGGNVTLQIGQENVLRAKNTDGTSLAIGNVVYLHGASGNTPEVRKALATGDPTSSTTIGVATEVIANNGTGFVTTEGIVSGFDTSAFAEGASLWLSATTAGALTTTRPTAPNHGVWIGVVVRSHATLGQIYVSPKNGLELDELHDVNITSVANGNFLIYNSSTSTWVNSSSMRAALDANNFKITNLATATANGDAVNKLYIDTVFGSTVSAATSATSAALSATSAATSATSAANSATAAANSATSAATSATSAATSYTQVQNQVGSGILRDLGSITEADTTTGTWISISTEANAAANSATAAANSASSAATSASSAATSRTSAATSATSAANSATAAATSASNAATSATSAATSASSAATSATAASTSATSASTSASSAATSASSAATSATSSAASATLANDWATLTSGPVAGGEYSAKWHAQASATSATTSASSAAAAATSATSAATSASSASTSASSAATSASSASASASAAAVSAASAATSASSAIQLTTIDAKGDLIVGTGADAVARLAVGVDGYVLSAASTTATGLSWIAAPSGLPSQTGNSGKYLTTNGTTASWAAITTDPLPQVMMMMGA